jgi:excisionase family DNA binding protein
MIAPRRYYLPREVAELLRVSVSTIYRMIEDGRLRAIRVRGGYRIPREAVEEIVGA